MSRFVLDSNNLWLLALSDRTMRVNNGPYSPDLNTQDLSGYVGDWKQVARIGSNQHCTHRELEVFGVALISGQKLEELCLNTYNHQLTINREGFMVQWLNPGGGRRVPNARSLYRRLNDVFDWSRYGVQIPIPVQTAWDRFELTTGKLIAAGGAGSPQLNKELEEKEKESQRLLAEKDKEIEELKKKDKERQAAELAAKKENERLLAEKDVEIQGLKKQAKEKDDQLAAKDKQIANLKAALTAFV